MIAQKVRAYYHKTAKTLLPFTHNNVTNQATTNFLPFANRQLLSLKQVNRGLNNKSTATLGSKQLQMYCSVSDFF